MFLPLKGHSPVLRTSLSVFLIELFISNTESSKTLGRRELLSEKAFGYIRRTSIYQKKPDMEEGDNELREFRIENEQSL